MADGVSVVGLRELEAALTLHLQDAPPTAAEKRTLELGFLAELLDTLTAPSATAAEGGDDWPTVRQHPIIPRNLYDERRPPTAPHSHRLVELFGNWPKACRAAHGLLPDGRTLGAGRPWSQPWGEQPTSTQDEVLDALRACARAVLRTPTTTDYYEWCRAERRRLTAAGSRRRVPTLPVIYRRYGGWDEAIAAAAITDRYLAAAHERSGPSGQTAIGGPRQALADLAADEFAALGFDDEERGRLVEEGFRGVALQRATGIAHALGGSLDWLAERTREPGQPAAPGVAFNAARFKELRRARALPEATVRRAVGLPLGPYRSLLNGSWAPTLGVVVELADLLGTDTAQLVA